MGLALVPDRAADRIGDHRVDHAIKEGGGILGASFRVFLFFGFSAFAFAFGFALGLYFMSRKKDRKNARKLRRERRLMNSSPPGRDAERAGDIAVADIATVHAESTEASKLVDIRKQKIITRLNMVSVIG